MAQMEQRNCINFHLVVAAGWWIEKYKYSLWYSRNSHPCKRNETSQRLELFI